MALPLVTLIVPVYNVQPFLPRCLESIKKQTYENLQVVLVDDASSDESGEMAKTFSEKHLAACFVRHDINKGLSGARNSGLEAAEGEWIAFLDSDDWIHENYISDMVSIAIRDNSDVVACMYSHAWDSGKITTVDPFGHLTNESPINEKIALLRNHVVTRLYRRTLFTETKLRFPENLRRAEDMAISIALLSYANNISLLKKPLYYYYQRSESLSNQNREHMDLGFIDTALNMLMSNISPKYKIEGEAHVIMERLYSKVMLSVIADYSKTEIKSDIKKFKKSNANWMKNPYISKFPKLKQLIIRLSGREHIFTVMVLIRAWNVYKRVRSQ